MSFKQNDKNNTIHLGNYEEFFILYMDSELTSEQMQMVDEFLTSHPDLRGEFEILMSTKLPAEEITINKEEFFAENMQTSSVAEDLLLYIDNELSNDRAAVVELELASNKDYHLQHQLLLQTKLDPSEQIIHPNKQDLYRRTERVIAFKMWMRVAAAVIVIAVMSVFYFRKSSPVIPTDGLVKTENKPVSQPPVKLSNDRNVTASENIAVAAPPRQIQRTTGQTKNIKADNTKEIAQQTLTTHNDDELVNVDNSDMENQKRTEKTIAHAIDATRPVDATVSFNLPDKENLNNQVVTSKNTGTYNIPEDPTETQGSLASNDKKGSVKGFLRKATRLIEKKTGFDPTNDNGELLIGAVAVKLK